MFLPFVAAYYLSFLFRTINATVAGSLTSEFGLGAGDLGLLTSVYYLTFAAAQIPIGILLDRYGPGQIKCCDGCCSSGRGAICRLGQFLAAPRRPSADRSWCRRIIDGRLESPRALVSQRTYPTAQRPDDHVGGLGAQRRQLCLRRSCWFRRVGEHCLRCSRLSRPDALLSSILLSQRCQHLYRWQADQIV